MCNASSQACRSGPSYASSWKAVPPSQLCGPILRCPLKRLYLGASTCCVRRGKVQVHAAVHAGQFHCPVELGEHLLVHLRRLPECSDFISEIFGDFAAMWRCLRTNKEGHSYMMESPMLALAESPFKIRKVHCPPLSWQELDAHGRRITR